MKLLRIALTGCLLAAMVWAADVTGKWTAQMQGRNGTQEVSMNLKADGDKLTGTMGGRMGDTDISNGKIDGDTISFDVVREFNGNSMTMHYTGKVSGDEIHFTVARAGGEGGNGGGGGRFGGRNREFTATRAK
ncbi:MAG TPA: hypothetical protein VHZ07_03845 [Bryobacteraceae bacterium]|jgi:hypothetical protein|nr:hypothetical protein [Bryobacteraceae bacterium]